MITRAEIEASLHSMLTGPAEGGPERFRRPVIDSRRAGQGDLFVALPGQHHDGQAFVADALERGATGVLVRQRPKQLPKGASAFVVPDTLEALQRLASWRRQHRRAKVIGVTGSVGKTTTKELIAAVLGTRYDVLKNEANYNTEIGLPLTLLELTSRHRRAVLEMAMRARGEIRTLCEIAQPDVGVVTNVGPTHMETLGSVEAIAAAKAELIESLPDDGLAVLNADDTRVRAMAGRTKARVMLYGESPDASVRATGVASRGLDGIAFRLHYRGDSADVRTNLLGKHNVPNALAAAAVALADGLSLAEVASALQAAEVPSRLRVLRGKNGSTLIDDSYNASPASVTGALDLLRELPGRHIAVLGDMKELGPAERDGHLEVGRAAAQTADVVHTAGELGQIIAEGARAAGHQATKHWPSKEALGDALAAGLRQGDVVLLKASRAMAFETLVEALED